MTLVAHVVGARPNFPKAAPVIRALAELGLPQMVIHTGQHYDDKMSDSFLRQLQMPKPDVNLGVGSGTHAEQTAAVMVGIEPVLLDRKPDIVVVYGDINSTIAAALVCSKLGIKVAHVEAGLRSGDRTMPEEINRILTDQLSDILFATSPDALLNLGAEGIAPDRVHLVGNPMIDSLLACYDLFDADKIRANLGLSDRYAVATLHRPANVDDADSVTVAVRALHQAADMVEVVIPLHPRGRLRLEQAGISAHPGIRILDPLSYIDFMSLVKGSAAVLTDSGGVQEETTIMRIPCLTMRPNTERPVTITHGTNRLTSFEDLPTVLGGVLKDKCGERSAPPLWDGEAGSRIANIVSGHLRTV